MVDFSSVSLKILSPDGKTVLAELDQIDRSGQRVGRGFREHGANLNRAASAGRELGFIMSGVKGTADGAAAAAAHIAEQIALSTKNAKVLVGAVGIGAIIGLGVQMFSIWKDATDAMKDFNAEVNKIGNQTALANMQGFGPTGDLKAKAEQIRTSTQEELDGLHKRAKALKLNDDEEKELANRIRERGRAQTEALHRQTAFERDRAFGIALGAGGDAVELLAMQVAAHGHGKIEREGLVGAKDAEIKKREALRQLALESQDKHYTEAQAKALRQNIEDAYDREMDILKQHLADMAQKVGDTFTESIAGSISDGISSAIQSGNIGDGFRALTGGILIGLGEMMQTIGTESLLAAKLMIAIVNALRAFAPEGAIGPALLLIAAGGVLKGIGASMGASQRSSGGGYGSSYGGGNLPQIIDRGLINPINSPNTAGLQARPSVIFAPTIIGANDAATQSALVRMVELGLARSGRRL